MCEIMRWARPETKQLLCKWQRLKLHVFANHVPSGQITEASYDVVISIPGLLQKQLCRITR